jgi:PhnB protein
VGSKLLLKSDFEDMSMNGQSHPKQTLSNQHSQIPPMTNSIVEPYLFFSGNCEQAVEFYRKALCAEVVMMMRYKESPEAPPPGMVPPNWGDKIMHASFRIGASRIMASDGSGDRQNFSGFSLSLAPATEAEAARLFAALAEGGKVTMPLGKTFWSPYFGMLTDRFGIGWMINLTTTQAP